MVQGIDFEHTFAPVLRPESLKLLVAIAVEKGLHLYQADVEAAFYHCPIDKKIWVKLPKGYDPDSAQLLPADAPPLYAELLIGLQGIPQGSYLWFKQATKILCEMGFQPTVTDPCLFVAIDPEDETLIGLYVDDLVIATKTPENMTVLISDLKSRVNIRAHGPLKLFCGISVRIHYSDTVRSVHLSQPDIARTIAERANVLATTPVHLPGSPGFVWTMQDAPTPTEKIELTKTGLIDP